MNPLVSIIIPCYNQERFIKETLQSVSNLTYSNWECIIVDDGSTDNSAKIITDFIAGDARFIYNYKKNGGVSSARNLGLDKAKGQFIQFLDADDILEKQKLELSILELQLPENKDVKIVISNFKMISEDSNDTFPPFCLLDKKLFNVEGFLVHWNDSFSIQMQCGFFDVSLFESIRFSEKLSAQEDWVVWVQLFKTDHKFIFIEKPLAFYRINPNSRMRTIGIDDNNIHVLHSFKEILSYDEFYTLSLTLITRLYHSQKKYKTNLNTLKKTNSYQTALMIKKILKIFGILKPSRSVFKILLRFKAK